MLVRNYGPASYSLTGLRCRATSLAKEIGRETGDKKLFSQRGGKGGGQKMKESQETKERVWEGKRR